MPEALLPPRCSSPAPGIALNAGREAESVRAVGRGPLSESRVTRERRPAGPAPNTFLLRALSLPKARAGAESPFRTTH
jgi:hypothetical protein